MHPYIDRRKTMARDHLAQLNVKIKPEIRERLDAQIAARGHSWPRVTMQNVVERALLLVLEELETPEPSPKPAKKARKK